MHPGISEAMIGIRGLARTLIAGMVVAGGVAGWRRSATTAVTSPLGVLREVIPGSPSTEQLVRINAGVQVVGGGLFAVGVAPRVMAIVLGASLVPTMLVGRRFGAMDDTTAVARQRGHVLKNAGLIGGLIFAALDTGGRPSLFWSGRRAADSAVATVTAATHSLLDTVER